MASVRLALPPSGFALHSRQLQRFLALPAGIRHASTAAPPKPRLLEKPERFNPPSHASRLRAKPKVYGAPLSEHERREQQKRRYPHMMPPEGTFMFWFLTNRMVHLWISLGILLTLTGGVWIGDFVHTTPYKDMLPPNSMFFAHPLKYIGRYVEVYDLHSAYISQKTAEMRRQKVDDVRKRAEYRKAHGLEQKEGEGVFGGWSAKADEEPVAPQVGEGGMPAPASGLVAQVAASDAAATPANAETYVDFEGKEKPVEKKKWLGIW